jgi:hypothetical protein
MRHGKISFNSILDNKGVVWGENTLLIRAMFGDRTGNLHMAIRIGGAGKGFAGGFDAGIGRGLKSFSTKQKTYK